MSKEDIAVCGLRYGKTKYQAEQIKKYIEENSLTEIKITILDSESKQMLDKIKEYCNNKTIKTNLPLYTKEVIAESKIANDILQILNEGSDK